MLLLFPEMRLKVKTGINNCPIDDSYSSDLQSLEIALDFLESQKNKNKTVILSDIFQSGSV
jgi:alanine racemase